MPMHFQIKKLKNSGLLLTGCFIVFTIIFTEPSKALVPYVFLPNTQNLKNTGISVGKTAAQLIKLGQAKEALRLGKLAVKLNPKDYRLWSILAEAQIRNKQLSKANLSLERAKELNPNLASIWFAQASISLEQKQPKDALIFLNGGLKIEPNNAGAYFRLGNAHIMLNELKKAVEAFKEASDLKSTFWEAINNQGIVLFELNKTQESIRVLRKALKISKNAEPMLALAAALNANEPKNTESIELAKQALMQNPNYVSVKYQKEQLWGFRLQKATKKLFSHPQLVSDIEKAVANSDFADEN